MENIIEVKKLSKSYGQRQVLKDMSFRVKSGTIHGLLGPNGAGKTTTMKCLLGLIKGDSGQLLVQNVDCTHNYNTHVSMGHLLEHPPLYDDLYVREYLTYMARIKGVKEAQLSQRIDLVADKLHLRDILKRRVGNLSKGYKQRLGIAQAIIHGPKIVILDEPTVGLDPQTVFEIRNLVLELKEDHTIIVSSHQLHEMELMCDEITILFNGSVLKSGSKEKISSNLKSRRLLELTVKGETKDFIEKMKSSPWFEQWTIDEKDDEKRIRITLQTENDVRAEVVRTAVEKRLDVLEVVCKGESLEDVFIEITRES